MAAGCTGDRSPKGRELVISEYTNQPLNNLLNQSIREPPLMFHVDWTLAAEALSFVLPSERIRSLQRGGVGPFSKKRVRPRSREKGGGAVGHTAVWPLRCPFRHSGKPLAVGGSSILSSPQPYTLSPAVALFTFILTKFIPIPS